MKNYGGVTCFSTVSSSDGGHSVHRRCEKRCKSLDSFPTRVVVFVFADKGGYRLACCIHRELAEDPMYAFEKDEELRVLQITVPDAGDAVPNQR